MNNGILFSTAIYLYKVNGAGAYEVVEGIKARCVVMGTGTELGFHVLVYNSQKVAQAQIPITASFSYKMNGLYCSCSDAASTVFLTL